MCLPCGSKEFPAAWQAPKLASLHQSWNKPNEATNVLHQARCRAESSSGSPGHRRVRLCHGSGCGSGQRCKGARSRQQAAERLVPVPDNTTSTLLELFSVTASLPRGARPRQADASHNSQSCSRTVPKSTWGSLLSLPPAQGIRVRRSNPQVGQQNGRNNLGTSC